VPSPLTDIVGQSYTKPNRPHRRTLLLFWNAKHAAAKLPDAP